MMLILSLPKDQQVAFKSDEVKLLISLMEGRLKYVLSHTSLKLLITFALAMHSGSSLFYPTIDLPPDAFGAHENPQSDKLVDLRTMEPQTATIVLAYFTRTGSELEYIADSSEAIQLNLSPFQ